MELCVDTAADGTVTSRTLSSVVRSGVLGDTLEAKLALLRQIASGLSYLHGNTDLAAFGLSVCVPPPRATLLCSGTTRRGSTAHSTARLTLWCWAETAPCCWLLLLATQDAPRPEAGQHPRQAAERRFQRRQSRGLWLRESARGARGASHHPRGGHSPCCCCVRSTRCTRARGATRECATYSVIEEMCVRCCCLRSCNRVAALLTLVVRARGGGSTRRKGGSPPRQCSTRGRHPRATSSRWG